jgi:signal peptidase II
MRPTKIFWILFPLLLALDQGSKEWAQRVLQFMTPSQVNVIPHVFYLTYVPNTGVAFGMFSGRNYWLALFVLVVLALGIWWSRQLDWRKGEVNAIAAMLISGAVGNLIDRMRYGHVVDFLDFHGIGYPWVFNIADSGITLSLVWILFRQCFPAVDSAEK